MIPWIFKGLFFQHRSSALSFKPLTLEMVWLLRWWL